MRWELGALCVGLGLRAPCCELSVGSAAWARDCAQVKKPEYCEVVASTLSLAYIDFGAEPYKSLLSEQGYNGPPCSDPVCPCRGSRPLSSSLKLKQCPFKLGALPNGRHVYISAMVSECDRGIRFWHCEGGTIEKLPENVREIVKLKYPIATATAYGDIYFMQDTLRLARYGARAPECCARAGAPRDRMLV